MNGEGEGSGDGCSRERKDMRVIAFLLEFCSLGDAKAVLLINGDKAKISELYRVFYQGVSAN